MIRTVVVTTMVAALMASPLAAQQLRQQDMQFAEKAAEGGLLEVQLGELATQQAKDQAVANFGQMMVDDHSTANQQLMDIAQQKGIQLPTNLWPSRPPGVRCSCSARASPTLMTCRALELEQERQLTRVLPHDALF